jgi:oxygen-independent coproporphyrinogen-3 oxidase
LQNGIPTEFPSTPATASVAPVDLAGEMGETMMMGLRLVQEGVSKSRFKSRFDSSLEDHYGSVVQRLLENGLLTNGTGDAIKLTHRGKMLGNQVFMEFV